MNIAFLLTPKNEVIYEYLDATMRQVMERMDHHGYTAIPLIDRSGKYVGTLTEGDLLRKLKNTPDLNFKNTGTTEVAQYFLYYIVIIIVCRRIIVCTSSHCIWSRSIKTF